MIVILHVLFLVLYTFSNSKLQIHIYIYAGLIHQTTKDDL